MAPRLCWMKEAFRGCPKVLVVAPLLVELPVGVSWARKAWGLLSDLKHVL